MTIGDPEDSRTGGLRSIVTCTCGFSEEGKGGAPNYARAAAERIAKSHGSDTGHLLASSPVATTDGKRVAASPGQPAPGIDAAALCWVLFIVGIVVQIAGISMVLNGGPEINAYSGEVEESTGLVAIGAIAMTLGAMAVLVAIIAWGVRLGIEAVKRD